jgi:hypothetical protein
MGAPTSRTPLAPLLSAVLLYLFLVAYRVLAAALVPSLLELWETSPRLAALAWLALLASPVGFVALAHRAAHRGLARYDGGKAARFASLRQGFFAWFAIYFASMASAFLLLFVFPPPPGEESLVALLRMAADVRLQVGVHAALWIATATLLYAVDRAGARSEA